MRINISAHVGGVSPRLCAVLEGLLDPLVEDRLTAQEAVDILSGSQRSLTGSVIGVSCCADHALRCEQSWVSSLSCDAFCIRVRSQPSLDAKMGCPCGRVGVKPGAALRLLHVASG